MNYFVVSGSYPVKQILPTNFESDKAFCLLDNFVKLSADKLFKIKFVGNYTFILVLYGVFREKKIAR